MNRLALQLRDLIVATDEYRRAEAAALGIGVAEAAALGEIHHRGPLPPSALVVRLGIASASVTALLDRLTVAGLVQREPHPTDRRSVLVTLTPRGRAAITAMFAMFTEDILAAVHAAQPEYVRMFTDVLGRIAASLRERLVDETAFAEELAARTGAADGDPVGPV
ncbi:MarR family winged helix-turn-helix transcriptional regulator [Pseudonocardia sp. McavD-2-B]|uniref:MarR family winged helix-turn-helix transcriptional regulator n=1 Tax=Pseudonocardia sp. McavD-2-B TaxID=2954499 RepID=UPI002096AE1A|nr:MarR family transcriptional regulator [Pseudonocardia sp. McavD-2-B]MCO7193333.1 MarR family transcriptional regulator [Pseudonocardia sp. McavD-2-B]